MADQMKGGIAWTDETWNPVRGCSRVSPGCVNCYAERMAGRFSGPRKPYNGLVRHKTGRGGGARWTGVVRLVPEHLADPLGWKRPRRVFVNSMSDLFHERLSNEEIAAVFGVMAASPAHTFQVLTKRCERMRDWFRWARTFALEQREIACAPHTARTMLNAAAEYLGNKNDGLNGAWRQMDEADPWPLPNVWLGASVEDQQRADERIPLLLDTPAAVRFVSYEPSLGPVDFRRWFECPSCGYTRRDQQINGDHRLCELGPGLPVLDWVIVGGESGPGARPFDLAWARSTIEQCRAAGVACFVKQLGARPYYRAVSGSELPFYQRDRKGGDPAEWPTDLNVREFPR